MRAGTLRIPAVIERDTGTGRGAMGSHTPSWATFAECRVAITPVNGRERYQALGLEATVDHEIRLRYLAGVEPKTFRVVARGRRFNVQVPLNVGERDRELLLLCQEEV